MQGVHPHLAMVIRETDFPKPIIVTEGVRTAQRQDKLLREGKSKTMNSRHLTGHAVDIAVMNDGDVTWEWPAYAEAAKAVKASANRLGIAVEWGGDWPTFKDGTHFQLSWADYPLVENPKTEANSKTVAAASVGVPIAAFLPEAFKAIAEFTGYLKDISPELVQWAQIAAVIAIAFFIVRERSNLNRREGV